MLPAPVHLAALPLLLLAAGWTGAFESLPSLPNVRAGSFRLSSRVSVEQIGGKDVRLQFEELYSRRQARAKIGFKTLRGPSELDDSQQALREGTFHLNKAHGILLTTSQNGASKASSCCPASEQLVMRLARTDQFDCALQAGSLASLADELPILGPASILLLLDRYKSRLKKINEFGLRVRNVDAVMFVYVPEEPQQQQQPDDMALKFYCLYAKSHLTNQEAVPLRISINRNDGFHVEYELLQFQLLASESLDALESIHAISDDIQFDQFALDRAIGCATYGELARKGAAAAAELNNPFHGLHERRFAFRAQVLRSIGSGERGGLAAKTMAVAYEGSLDMLRVDEQAAGERSTSLLLINFQLGHLYQVLEQRARASHEDSPLATNTLDRQIADGASSSSCILVKLPARSEVQPALAYDLDRLLLGAPASKFLYLGAARVRGIWTRAYEAHDTAWPAWLEQRVQVVLRRQSNPEDAQVVLNTVIYLTQREDGPEAGASPLAGRLVLMEISRLRAGSWEQVAKTTLELFDFNWSLESCAPDGSPLDDYFSLADRCSASTLLESSHYAHAHLLLEASRSQPAGASQALLQLSAGQRNLALLEGLQNHLKLAPTLVYDLDSKLKARKELGGAADSTTAIALAATFRLARHVQQVAQLRFYGTGRPKKLFQFKLMALKADSLSDCFYMAAHFKRDTFFAYSADRIDGRSCLIDHAQDPEVGVRGLASEVTKPKRFDVFTNGPMEIYFVRQFEDCELIQQDPIGRLGQGAGRAYASSQLMRKFSLAPEAVDGRAEPVGRVEFYVKNFELRELNEKRAFKIDDALMSDTNKHSGLCLIPTDAPNALVEPSGRLDEMSFGTCQTACLADAACQSFSVCLAGAKFQCILSQVDLRQPDILLKLLDIRASRDTKLGRLFEIWHQNSTLVRVKRQANCELHAKLYLDLFHEPGARGVHFHLSGAKSAPIVRQVAGRDECARACYEQTYKLLHEDLATNLQLKFGDLLAVQNTEGDQAAQESTAGTIIKAHKARLKGLCKEFLFLDAAQFNSLSSDLQVSLRGGALERQASLLGDAEPPANNYCLTGERKLVEGEEFKLGASDEFKQLPLERFRFKFELLFERHYGVQLAKSRMSKEEALAYEEVRLLQGFKRRSSMELMEDFLKRRENVQDYVRLSHFDESQCAQLCVQQMRGLWPACKSFDMILVSTGDQVGAVCRLNSMTLREAIKHQRGDLLDYNTSLKNVQVWHFEPRLGDVERELDLASRLEASGATVQKAARLNVGLECLIVLAALAVGLLLGLSQGTKLVAATKNAANGVDETRDTRSLVENNDTTIDLRTMSIT